MGYRNHRTGDNDRRSNDRSSPIRNSREGNERGCESHSSSAERAIRDRSNSRCRNKSPFTSSQAKETKINNDGNKYSSNRNLERSYESDNCIFSGLTMNSDSYGSYDNYAGIRQHLSQHFLRPTSMFEIQPSPIIWPVVPGMFPMPFPPIPPNVHRLRPPPPRFANFVRRGRGNLHRP